MAAINAAFTSLALAGLLAPAEAFITTASSRHHAPHHGHLGRIAARTPTLAATDGSGGGIPDSVTASTLHHHNRRSHHHAPEPNSNHDQVPFDLTHAAWGGSPPPKDLIEDTALSRFLTQRAVQLQIYYFEFNLDEVL